MNSNRRNTDILRKIIRYCNEIDLTSERFGNSLEALQQDFVYRNATAMCILQIGELTTHLSDDFRAAHSEIPWRDIRGMRNVAAHHYGEFSAEYLWETMEDDIPVLREKCEAIVQEYEQASAEAPETDQGIKMK